MRRDLLLPFVEPIARDAQFTGDLGRRALPGIQELHGVLFEFWCEPSSLPHCPPPWRSSCPLLRCPSNPGQLIPTPFCSLVFGSRLVYEDAVRDLRDGHQ